MTITIQENIVLKAKEYTKINFSCFGGNILKRFLKYLIWTITITIIVYLGLRFRVYLGNEAEISFDNKSIMIFNIVFPILVGVLFRLPKFLEEKKGRKKWRFDWVKLITIAFPSLYIALLPYLIYSSFGETLIFVKQILLLEETSNSLTMIAGIVFGYVLIDSVK